MPAALLVATLPAAGTAYYVSTAGSDVNDGLSTQKPWKTLERVNLAKLAPGDTVRFRCGETWRGSLRPVSGTPGRPVLYTSYGQGPKPTFLGSVARKNPVDWIDEGNGVWSTGGRPQQPSLEMPPITDAERAIRWGLHTERGVTASMAAVEGASSPAACRVECKVPGTESSHIQLITTGLHIRMGHTYRLLMRARATKPFDVNMPPLMKADAPWDSYSDKPGLAVAQVTETPTVFRQFYRARATSDNARLTVYLGSAMPAGATLEIDRVQFAECDSRDMPAESPFTVDVGNIIFDGGKSCGWKVWRRADLTEPRRFWYNRGAQKVYLVCNGNPAKRYQSIECALYHHIIDESNCSHVTYDGLALKYGGAHGIGGGYTDHITVRNCDISFIGGADQYGDGRTVRFGNGIEFWGAAHDNLVERCRIWEVYDAALTNQNTGAVVTEANITYRNNIIWNSEYSFEYWNRPETSQTRAIRFVHNTCVNAGHGWSHAQRPDPSGRHLCFYDSQAQETDIIVRNNIFFEATRNAFYAPTWSQERMGRLVIDGNLWCQKAGAMISANGRNYAMDQFDQYRADFEKETHSIVGNPLFTNTAKHDYRLRPGSPCIGAGVPAGVTTDFAGRRFRADHPDIGTYSITR